MPVAPFEVPSRLGRLYDLAYNLWWSWDASARTLFRELDPALWYETKDNLVLFLHRIDPVRLERAASDSSFLARFDRVVERFDDAVRFDRVDSWVAEHKPELLEKTVAYFSAEFGIHRALPIYSGGLGVLAGDHIKQASDLGLPLVAISLLYRQGYLSQRLDNDGWQEDVPSELEPWAEPTTRVHEANGDPVFVDLSFDHQPVRLAVWKVNVGRVALYLLDADVEGNPEWTRQVSSRLYGGDQEHRLRQELILGIGGVRALRKLGIEPAYWHANEGHAAFHLLERLRELVVGGMSVENAEARVRATTVFTTHTPVPAGHDVFPPALMDRYFWNFWPRLGMTRDEFLALGEHGGGEGFNLTALSMRLAGHRNGVSLKHGEITRAMWHDIWPGVGPSHAPVTSITNGVHLPTWISPRVTTMLDEYLPSDWRARQDDPEVWTHVHDIPDEVFWKVHVEAKQALLIGLRERTRRRWAKHGYDPSQVVTTGPFLAPRVLTLGFARRFATYKRATLLFHDEERLARILNHPDRPAQIVFAGKAHPADEGGKRLIQEIFWRSKDPKFGGRIAFAEDYGMGLASLLVAGVDVWLNNPRAPLEASGTSGMKAAANGVPNVSILDGWWLEGWQPDNSNGWGIEPSVFDGPAQDAEEANRMYETLERQVVPAYYDLSPEEIPHQWVRIQKEAMRTVAPRFSAERMVIEYINRLYAPAAEALTPV